MSAVSDVFFVQLKRFTFSATENRVKKIQSKVKAPSVLLLEGKTFELASFVTHLGIDGAGHYTATVWDKLSESYSLSNDSVISTGICEANSRSDTAYIYCYVQASHLSVNHHEEVSRIQETLPKRNTSLPKVHPKRQKTSAFKPVHRF